MANQICRKIFVELAPSMILVESYLYIIVITAVKFSSLILTGLNQEPSNKQRISSLKRIKFENEKIIILLPTIG